MSRVSWGGRLWDLLSTGARHNMPGVRIVEDKASTVPRSSEWETLMLAWDWNTIWDAGSKLNWHKSSACRDACYQKAVGYCTKHKVTCFNQSFNSNLQPKYSVIVIEYFSKSLFENPVLVLVLIFCWSTCTCTRVHFSSTRPKPEYRRNRQFIIPTKMTMSKKFPKRTIRRSSVSPLSNYRHRRWVSIGPM